jgi:hypothetical protein
MFLLVIRQLFASTLFSFLLATPLLADSGDVIYDNGGDLGISAEQIAGQTLVSDSFSISSNTMLSEVRFSNWLHTGDTASSIHWWVTTGPFSGVTNASGIALLTPLGSQSNPYGYVQVWQSFTLPSLMMQSGSYWLQLGLEQVSHFDYGYWGLSSGPSQAYLLDNSSSGSGTPVSIPSSQSFQILATGPPSLTIQRTNNGVALSWPLGGIPFRLLQNSSLSTTNWIGNTNSVSTNTGVNLVIISPATGSRFFRLVYP